VDIPASVDTLRDQLPRPDWGFFQVPSFAQDADGNLYTVTLGYGGAYRFATLAQDSRWNGDNAMAGVPGNGMTWGDANNWTRGSTVDSAFVAEDHVFFTAGSAQTEINLQTEQLVSAATFQASYTLKGGTLRILSGNVTVAADVTATIASDLTAETAHRSIRKLGAGTLLIEGNATQTVVKEGTLGGNGTLEHLTVRGGATLAPGAPIGILTVEDSFTMHPGSTLEIELNGSDNSDPLSPQYDQLIVGGQFNSAGTLKVTLINDGSGMFAPVNGETFEIVVASGGFIGPFDEFDLPELAAGLVWEMDPTDGHKLLIRATAALPGDYNVNGVVDAADYVVWQGMLGDTGRGLAADGTGPSGVPDEIVDALDYGLWRANFGATLGGPAGQATGNIPEPAATLHAMWAGLFLITRRRTGLKWLLSAQRIGHGSSLRRSRRGGPSPTAAHARAVQTR
jgi:hypothetical protein